MLANSLSVPHAVQDMTGLLTTAYRTRGNALNQRLLDEQASVVALRAELLDLRGERDTYRELLQGTLKMAHELKAERDRLRQRNAELHEENRALRGARVTPRSAA